MLSLLPELGWPSYQQRPVERWQGSQHSVQQDYIAEEVPVSLIYNGEPHVVMLATPTNLEEFALGFSMTEGIIKTPQELLSTRTYNRSNGIEVHLRIPSERFVCLADKGRNLTGRTGCGLCGASTLQQAIRQPNAVEGQFNHPCKRVVFCVGGHQATPNAQPINRIGSRCGVGCAGTGRHGCTRRCGPA